MTIKRKPKIDLVKSRSGQYTLVVEGEDGIQRAYHSLYAPEKEALQMVHQQHFHDNSIIIVLGIGLGYHIKELSQKYPNSLLIAIEASSEIFEYAKKYVLTEPITRAKFIVSEVPEKILSTITLIQIENGMPPLYLFTHQPSITSFNSYYQPLIDSLKKTVSYRAWDKLRYKKFKEDKLNILYINFDYFLGLEIENAIKKLGHNLIKINGTKKDKLTKLLTNITKAIIEYHPDFILTVNHFGFDEEGIIADFLNSIEMPVAIWYVDSPDIIVAPYSKNIKENKIIFLWDRSYIKNMKDIGFKHVYYLPLATDPEIFKPIKSNKYKSYTCAVSFVGNSMVEASTKQLNKIPYDFRVIVEKLAEELANQRLPYQLLIDKQPSWIREKLYSLDESFQREIEEAVYWKATFLYRYRAIRQLREFHPVIFGDTNWRKLLDSNFEVRGRVNYYNELPLIYNFTKVNFNTTSLQMPEAVNQRVFDVSACCSFLITDYQKSLEDLFDVNNEIVTYRDHSEIPELIKFYLNRSDLRENISRAAMNKVLSSHTYCNRIQFIIDKIKDVFN